MLLTDHDRLLEMSVELDAIARRAERPDIAAVLKASSNLTRLAIKWAREQAEFDCGATSVLGGPIVDITRESV